MTDNRPIGIFDSGVGGLTVLSEVRKLLPGEGIVYLGDTARVPYGTKSEETVKRFSRENTRFLLSRGVKAVVVACNTSTALALGSVRRMAGVPVVGVVEPGAKAAAAATRNGRVGVIGTEATIASGAYQRALRKINPMVLTVSQPCPLFVPLAENGWLDNKVTTETALIYLTPLVEAGVDTLVLGCTHYPLLKKVIGKVMGPKVTLIDSAFETARRVRDVLAGEGLLGSGKGTAGLRFFVTDHPAKFTGVGRTFLGTDHLTATRCRLAVEEEEA
jgi:glutamate racemase